MVELSLEMRMWSKIQILLIPIEIETMVETLTPLGGAEVEEVAGEEVAPEGTSRVIRTLPSPHVLLTVSGI
jgi:hypothetical protein